MVALFFGSPAGGWEYSRFNDGSVVPALLLCAVLVPLLVGMLQLTVRYADRRPWLVVLIWLAASFPMHLALRSLHPITFEAIITNEGSDSYYHATQRIPVGEFVAHFEEVAPSMPLHIRNNMPGKALLYYAIEAVAPTPSGIGGVMMLLSDLGGVLVYLVAQELYRNRLASAYSLAFYQFIPARLCFFPLPNTVTPLFILLPFLLWLIYLRTRRTGLLPLLGLALCGCFLFEPLPFVMGLVFVGLLVRSLVAGDLALMDLVRVFVAVPASFFAALYLVKLAVGFDALAWFGFLLADARDFNVREGREYGVWLLNNPPDFLFNIGVASAVVFLLEVGRGFGTLRKSPTDVDAWFTLSVALTLATLLVWGVNRGETQRLWIFLAVFMQIPVARFCSRQGASAAVNVLTANVVQGAIFLSLVRFVNG